MTPISHAQKVGKSERVALVDCAKAARHEMFAREVVRLVEYVELLEKQLKEVSGDRQSPA